MKIRIWIGGSLLLTGVCLLGGMNGLAQVSGAGVHPRISTELAVTYAPERAELAPGHCGCFWLEGAGVDASVTFGKGFGVAADLTGGHAGSVAPGVDVNKIAFTVGPRFTWTGHGGAADRRRLQIFGQGLIGGAEGFGGMYPSISGASASAGSMAVEAGGGVNLLLAKHLGLRLVEAEYVRTSLPNAASNTQNDMRISFGLVYHLGEGERRAAGK
jgi:hypothetical protein